MPGGQRSGLRSHTENQLILPAVSNDNQPLWTGERKQLGGFQPEFVTGFLKTYYASKKLNTKQLVQRVNASGRPEYQCFKCKLFFTRHTPDAENFITLDHRVSIRDYVIQKTDEYHDTISGHRWFYRLLDECKAVHLDIENLDPKCMKCNSSDGGNKDLDGEMRFHRRASCPHDACKVVSSSPY